MLLLVATLVGRGALSRLGGTRFADPLDQLIVAPWLGLLILAVALLGMSLAVPLSPLVGLLVALALVLLSLRSAATRQAAWPGSLSLRHRWAGAMLTVTVAALNSGPVTWSDTGYYHYSVIQWLTQYGSVPGVALLFSNLGFTSAWFALAAPLSPIGISSQVSAVTNGAVTLLVLGQFGFILARSLNSGLKLGLNSGLPLRLSDRFLLLFYGLLLPVMLWLSPLAEIRVSPSPDYPVVMLVGVVAWAMLVVSQGSATERSRLDGLIPLALAAGAVSLKLTALPLLGVTLGFWLCQLGSADRDSHSHRQLMAQRVERVSRLGRGRALLIGLVFVSVMLSPLLLSSLVTSGCPLYPSAVLCGDLPWSPTPQAAATIAANTHGWTTWYGPPPAGTHPWLWTVSQWLRTSRQQQITAGLLLAAMLAAGYVMIAPVWQSLLSKDRAQLDRWPLTPVVALASRAQGKIWVAALGLSGIIFLMLTSPFFRFSLPYITLLLALLLAVVMPQFEGWTPIFVRFQQRWGQKLVNRRSASTLATALALVVIIAQLQPRPATLLLPPPLPQSVIVTKRTNDIVYSAPESGDVPILPNTPTSVHKDLCWAARLPCAFEIPANVQLRDADRGIAGGFVRR